MKHRSRARGRAQTEFGHQQTPIIAITFLLMAVIMPSVIEHVAFSASLAKKEQVEIAANPSYCKTAPGILEHDAKQK